MLNTVRDLMRRFLERSGYAVVCAEDGPQGLRLARDARPSLNTLDMVMSKMSGWDVLTELKSTPALAGIPVLMATLVDGDALSTEPGSAQALLTAGMGAS